MKVLDLFGNETEVREKTKSRKSLFDDYDGFTDKFKAKLTTDDCYTPPEVYAVVLEWVRSRTDLTGKNIVRPFYPGGDYENEEYLPEDVVIDNPPFSILARILRFYKSRDIGFFLFAPYLTLFSSKDTDLTYISASANIVYANGAKVNTGFITNLFGDIVAMSAPDLKDKIEEIQKKTRKETTVYPPKYKYPPEIVMSTTLGYFSAHGINFELRRGECQFISALESQRKVKKGIFGSGLLVSKERTHAAEEAKRKAEEAKRKAEEARRKAEEARATVWELSEAEHMAIERLKNRSRAL